jgi:diphthamide biosynthesis protein 2
VFDPVYYHTRRTFSQELKSYPNIRVRKYCREQNTSNSSDDLITAEMSLDGEYSVFYVGTESLALTNCILTNGSRKVWSYDPTARECRLESKSVNKMLIKRFCNIEKIKSCKIIGILIGTLGIKNFREVINRMKQVIKAADKKFYIVSIGKPNPPKLANFAEIGAFVMVGCPENSLLDCAEFYQPIVTPYELEIACVDRPWEIDYISDSSTLLDSNYIDIPTVDINRDNMNDKAVEKFRSLDIAVNYLNDRTWSGLQQRLGEDEPAVLKQGQFGIAGFYEKEPDGDSRTRN